MGDPFVGDRSLWCFHFWQSGRRFALSNPFGSGPMGEVTLGGSLQGTRRPNSRVPTGTSSESLRAFRVQQPAVSSYRPADLAHVVFTHSVLPPVHAIWQFLAAAAEKQGLVTYSCDLPTYYACLHCFLGLWHGLSFFFLFFFFVCAFVQDLHRASQQLDGCGSVVACTAVQVGTQCAVSGTAVRYAPPPPLQGTQHTLRHNQALPCTCDSKNITGAFNFEHYESPALAVQDLSPLRSFLPQLL